MAINDLLIDFIHDHADINVKHLGTQVIVTEHLVLAPFSDEDIPYAYEWATNPKSFSYHCKSHATKENLPLFLEKLKHAYKMPYTYYWCFHERLDVPASDQHIDTPVLDADSKPVVRMYNGIPYSPLSAGVVYVNQFSFYNTCAELDFVLGYKYWPTEHMPEALSAVIDFLFDKVGVHRVACRMRVDNLPGSRMLRRMGFKLDGVLRELAPDTRYAGSWYDVSVYSVLRTDWERQKALNKPYNLAY